MNNNLIPSVDTNDLDPKTPMQTEGANTSSPAPENPEKKDSEPQKKEGSLFVKGLLALVIVGAIVGLGILLPIKIVPNASSFLASVFHPKAAQTSTTTDESSTSTETVTFSADKMSIKSEDSVKIDWNGPVRNDGQYVMRYSCAPGVNIVMLAADGTKPAIPCDTDFRFVSLDNTLSLAIQSRFQSLTEVPVSFAFVDNSGAVTKFGDVRVTVINNFPENASASSTPSTGSSNSGAAVVNTDNSGNTSSNTSSSNTSGSTGTTNLNQGSTGNTTVVAGKPDLVTHILAVGILDKTTGAFIPTTSFSANDRIAVQFQVANVGTGASGSWRFNALLPTVDNKIYQSAWETPLNPGGSIVFTLAFDGVKQGGNPAMLIDADPDNAVAETNESNNTATAQFLNVNGGGSNGTGKADLSVSLIDTGRMSGNTFVEDSSINTGDRAAVQFKVTNIGGEESGSWRFEADVSREDDDDFTYNSGSQTSLLPGQSTVVTVAFDDLEAGRHSVDITVDPSNNLDESSRSNNDLSATLRIND
jgi:hypothetical protein